MIKTPHSQPPAPNVDLRTLLHEARAELKQRGNSTEEDTRNALISPFLDSLGYDPLCRRSEYSDEGNTPDEVIYSEPPGASPRRYCQIILEAKRLGHNFDRGSSRTETPTRQIKRYLRNHQAAGPNTFGILTDGEKYRIYQRTGTLGDIQYHGEYNIFEPTVLKDDEQTDEIDKLFSILHRNVLSSNVQITDHRYSLARELCKYISDKNLSSYDILEALCNDISNLESLSEDELTGQTLDAFQNDWKRADWCHGPSIQTDSPQLDGPPKVVTAFVEYRYPDDGAPDEITRRDMSLAARAFARQTTSRTAVVVARQANNKGVINKARIAVHHLNHTGMTSEFDPYNPPISVLRAIDRITNLIRSSAPLAGQSLADAVTVKAIRKEFYEAIANWTRARQLGRNEVYRRTVLRHLIRTVFAWILKEDGIIPSELFEESFALQHSIKSYHREVLMFMFHHGLNKPKNERTPHPDQALKYAINKTPFLNGSLFAEHPGDVNLDLSLDHYFSVSDSDPGLFTIMSRYDWTTAEHTPGESDQTIDPEMLSNLFENLFATTENEDDDLQKRMPRGTYYTPSDVVAEMVKDALTAASGPFAPPPPYLELMFDINYSVIPKPRCQNLRLQKPRISRKSYSNSQSSIHALALARSF